MNEPRKILLVFLIVMAFGLVALIAQSLWDAGRRWLTLIVASLVLLILALTIHYSHAHDHGRPELDSWFRGLQSKAKDPCCDGSDATHLNDVDWETKDGHYRVRIDGEWVDVPESAVIDGPNRAGYAMVWPTWKDGQRTARCFMPGSMT